MTSLGHVGTVDPSKLQNLIQAGHGFHVHAANALVTGHEAIDQAQNTVHEVSTEATNLPHVISVALPNAQASVNHVWNSSQIKTVLPLVEHIPEVTGWL